MVYFIFVLVGALFLLLMFYCVLFLIHCEQSCIKSMGRWDINSINKYINTGMEFYQLEAVLQKLRFFPLLIGWRPLSITDSFSER